MIIEEIIAQLSSSDIEERLTALDVLQSNWDSHIADVLLKLVNDAVATKDLDPHDKSETIDDDEIVWSIAVRILGEMDEKRAIEPLKQLLHHGNDDLVCEAAVALGHLHATDAVKFLIPLLTYGYYTVRLCAAEALGEIGSTEAASFLLQALYDDTNDGEYDARSAIAKALGEIGDKRVLAHLQNAMQLAHEVRDSKTTDFFNRRPRSFEHYIEELKIAIAKLRS